MAELEAQKAKLTKKEVVKEEPKPPAKKKEDKQDTKKGKKGKIGRGARLKTGNTQRGATRR